MSVINLLGGNDQATDDNIRRGVNVIPVWVKEGGIILPNGLVYMRKMSDVQQISDIAAELVNERKLFESGSKYLNTNDGTNWSFTVTYEGDAAEEVASLIGQAIGTYPSIGMGVDYGRCGHMVLFSTNPDKDLRVCNVMFDCGVKLTSVPGTQDGEIAMQVEFYTDLGRQAEMVWGKAGVSEGGVPAFEIFWDNGSTVVNAAAPNGVLTTFTLGYGNDSYATPAAPLILPITNDTSLSTKRQYMYYVRVDGVDMNDSQVTFNSATKVLTFTTAPADGAKLEVAYLVDRAGTGVTSTPPHSWGTSLGSGSNFLYNWKSEQRA